MTTALIDSVPKAELHVHLEGTLEPEMLLALARRNNVEVPWSSVEQAKAAYQFTGLEHFLPLLWQGAAVLRRSKDFYDLTLAYLERAAADAVTRAEIFFGAQTFLDLGVPIADQLDGVLSAFDDGRAQWGIDAALILTAQRHRTQATALELVELTAPWANRVLGYGLGGAERDNPPQKFADYFAQCRARGFRTTVHAGEDGPPDYIRAALDECRVDRIDHGVAAASDEHLVRRLRDEGIALTMCPLSNLALNVVDQLSDHPLARLMDAGVLVTVNSDDPPYFGGYLNDNYAAVGDALGLDSEQMLALARNSFTGSFLDAEAIKQQHRLIDAFLVEHAELANSEPNCGPRYDGDASGISGAETP